MSTPVAEPLPAEPLPSELRALLGAATLHGALREIVSVADSTLVGMELVVAGAEGTPFADPRALRRSMAALGASRPLDEWSLGEAERLSVQVPEGVPVWCPVHPDSFATGAGFARGESVVPVLDVPTDALVFRAPDVMRAADVARRSELPVMIGDITLETVLPLVGVLDPDIVRLAPSVLRHVGVDAGSRLGATLAAISTGPGPLLLAAGVDDEVLASRARAYGVAAGTGAGLAADPQLPACPPSLEPSPLATPVETGLFDFLAQGGRPLRATKGRLVELSHELERVLVSDTDSCVLVGSFQEARHFTPATVERWTGLAEHCALAVAAAEGMPPEPAPGVSGLALHPDDPVCGEWHVAALSETRAAVLTARDLGDDGPDSRRRFDFLLTYDRRLAAAACRGVLGRLPGLVYR